METKYTKAKCKRSSEMEPREERKSFKVSIQDVLTKGLKSTNSRAEEKPCLRKCGLVIKYNKKQKDVEKAPGPGNNGSSLSKSRSVNQIDDKAPSKQFTGTQKSARVEIEQKDQEGCLAPSSTHAGFKVSFRHNPAFGSREKLLPAKTVQDIKVPRKEMMEILKHEAPQEDEQSLKKGKKKLASHEAVQKEFHDSLKARVAELRQETTMFNQELRRHATMCMQLIEDNTLLMDELKKRCEPHVIEILEAKNPDKNPQTD